MRAILAAAHRRRTARWPAAPRRCRSPDASVDGAVCSDAWHWFDGARAADELARVVRPGGGVVVCVTYPRWYGSDDAPDWWLDLVVVHTALPKGDHPALVSGWRRPDVFEGHPAFEEIETRGGRRSARLDRGDRPPPHSRRRPRRRTLGDPRLDRDAAREEPFVHHTDRERLVAHGHRCRSCALPERQRAMLGQLDCSRAAASTVDIPYRAELWITRRRPAPAPPRGPAAAAS